MEGFKEWFENELNEGVRGRIGNLIKKLAVTGMIPSTLASAGSLVNMYLGGDPAHTNLMSLFGVGAGGLSMLLDKIGNELANSDDPEYQKALEELERAKEEYGWFLRRPTAAGIKRREEREKFNQFIKDKVKVLNQDKK